MFLSVYQTVKIECIVLANVMQKSSTHTYQEWIVMVVVDCPEARSYALILRDVSVQRCHIDGDQYHVTFEGPTFDFFDELGRVLDIAILCTLSVSECNPKIWMWPQWVHPTQGRLVCRRVCSYVIWSGIRVSVFSLPQVFLSGIWQSPFPEDPDHRFTGQSH